MPAFSTSAFWVSAQQFGGVQAGQPSVPLADGAAGGFDDDRVTHSARLEHVSLALTSGDAATPLICGEGMFYWH